MLNGKTKHKYIQYKTSTTTSLFSDKI